MTKRPPRVGFVSLGCPKALVDSERIVTELRAEGYLISSTYKDSDLVIVNTCGFIDAAVQESLELLGLTGPEQTEEVLRLVHDNLPRPHEPFGDLVPAGGVLLTPKHYAYLKIAEGCNHHCTFCIIPSLRGPLVSRPIGSVVREASNLVKSGVKELLVIAQDTAAYGQDVKYKLDFIGGRAVKTNIKFLSRRSFPARSSENSEGHETPGKRIQHGTHQCLACDLSGHHDSFNVHHRLPGRN